jgi:single-strand DNA-binding protein
MLNKVMLIGRVGSDPEIKVTSKDEKFAKLSLATNKKYKVGGVAQEKTAWHMVKVFDPRLAETIEKYVTKGTTLYVEGEIDYSKFTDENGVTKTFTEIVVPKFSGVIRMLGSKNSTPSKPEVKQTEEEEVVIPF